MATADLSRTTKTVRKQYELLPYPHRDPADENQRLLATGLDDLGAINFHCYSGKRNLQTGFRALVAGGGTGDAVIYLAHQLKDTDAQIVYLDLSDASQQIARKRAACRGLENNITWINGSILDLPQLNLEPFDYINCCGVLHHLKDPAAGLQSLTSVLKPDGALGLMLYGLYGRTGIYQMQELLKPTVPDRTNPLEAVEQVRALLKTLPESNWHRRATNFFKRETRQTNEAVYDMFLHSQDRGYSIPQLYELLDGAALSLAQFTIESRLLYQTDFLNGNPNLKRTVAALPLREQQSIAELYWGAVTTHAFWATRNQPQPVNLQNADHIPFFSRTAEILGIRESILNTSQDSWLFEIPGKQFAQSPIRLELSPVIRRFVELIDAEKTIAKIGEIIVRDSQLSPAINEIHASCSHVIRSLQNYDLILLRHQSVPPICTW